MENNDKTFEESMREYQLEQQKQNGVTKIPESGLFPGGLVDQEFEKITKQIADEIIQKDIQEQRGGRVTLIMSIAYTRPELGVVYGTQIDKILTDKANAYLRQYNEQKNNGRGL